ncbi:unnamed protein product [Adineta ricciae]|uniref:G-protein coupled receptors family 1 profile domain-containing protein n=1 Tax=Adineta ricciae TaxID=249248 RepID=A0A814FNX6_ADIRI|nr:unnamed protein product [Adineta ricciae]
MTSILPSIQIAMIRYGMTTYLALGNIGNFLALLIFSNKNHRRNPCSVYLGVGSLFNILGINLGIIPLVYALDHPDPLPLSLSLCKWRQYALHAILMIDRILIVFACFDRFAVSSSRPSIRRWSNIKLARWSTIAIILFWFIICIHILVYQDIQHGSCGMFGTYSLIFSIYSIFIIGLIPPLLMLIFGILTMRNLKQIHTTQVHLHQRDRQFLAILAAEVIVYLTCTALNPITIRSEQVGSIPRPIELIAAQHMYPCDTTNRNELKALQVKAIRSTIEELERTGSKIITDGEQTKSSFLTYPICGLKNEYYAFSSKYFALTFSNGHRRSLPHLIKSPFRYTTYAHVYVDEAKKYTNLPIKQAIIAPSALSMVYPQETIPNYTREQFLNDLINEAEIDVRKCFTSGAHSVQLDFSEARFSLKVDPTGRLLQEFVQINNRLLNRFESNLRHRLGVHVCAGCDKGCYHSIDVNYLLLLPEIFDLKVGNFFLQFSSETSNRHEILSCIRDSIQPWQRVFIGVTDPLKPKVETPEEVCEQVLEAAEYIPIEQLGTTDDCGFSPFDDDQSVSRQIAFEKIRARIQGTKLAEEKLNKKQSIQRTELDTIICQN